MAARKTGVKQSTQRQKQILSAAMEVFSRKGYAAATMPEIAESAGVAAGTIYIYYPGKRELFIAVIQSLIFATPLLNLFEKVQKMPAEQFPVIFKSIIQNRLNLSEDSNMTRFLSLMGEIQRDPELKAMYLEQLIQPLMSRMEAFYRTRIESGKVRPLEPAVIVRAIGGMIIGLVILKVLEGDTSPINHLPREKVAEELMNFVFYGLSSENQPAGAKQGDTA